MFEKLLSLLPYNPGMAHQMAFYGQRMREEASIRRTGVVFLVLAFMVQFFAVISPPQSTTAASNNDLINGGFGSASEAASDCRNNIQGYKDILANYGVSCSTVSSAPMVTLHSTDYNRQLYSMGRLPYGIAGETPVNINGKTYYLRYLWGWDRSGTVSTYRALKVTSSNNKTYFLLSTCGNLTSIGFPQPVPQPPNLTIKKTTLAGFPVKGSEVAPGTVLGYQIDLGNSGGDGSNVIVRDTLPANTDFQSMSQNSGANLADTYHSDTRTAEWGWNTLPKNSTHTMSLKVKVAAKAPNGTKICNVARLNSGQTSDQICVTVKVNAPPPPVTPPPPTPTCQNGGIPANSPECLPCTQSISSQDTLACVTVHKTAANLTTGTTDANNTTANAGDEILYTLYAKNTGKDTVKGFIFTENLSDVMDYADPTDLHGGTLDNSDQVSWPALDIAAGATASEQITIKVKDPIPATPADPGDPGHFDMVMTNVYGNTININLPGTPIQSVETTSSSLPNTGPGAGLFISGLIMVVAGYFYGRSRLLARESALAVEETVGV